MHSLGFKTPNFCVKGCCVQKQKNNFFTKVLEGQLSLQVVKANVAIRKTKKKLLVLVVRHQQHGSYIYNERRYC